MFDRDMRFFEDGLQAIKGSGDLKGALGNLVQLAATAANSTASSLYMKDATGKVLKPLVSYGLPAGYIAQCGDIAVGDQCCGRAVAHRKPWIVSDMLNDPLFASARQGAVDAGLYAAFSVPVINGEDDAIGALACHFSKVHTPTPQEIARNRTWASLIAYTISQYQEAGRKAVPADERDGFISA